MLGRLYADAARRITDAGDLGDLTATPPASQAGQLLAALTPAVQAAREGAPPSGFTKELDGQDFGDRLRHVFLGEIEEDYSNYVRGIGTAERAEPGNRYSM